MHFIVAWEIEAKSALNLSGTALRFFGVFTSTPKSTGETRIVRRKKRVSVMKLSAV